MDFLARDGSPFDSDFWSKIDKTVIETASRTLIGRRFLSIYGPLGSGSIMPLDLSVTSFAAQTLSNKEDELIFYGNEFVGVTGILNTKGVQKLKIGDWSTGENPYIDIVKAINMIREKGIVGRIVLALSQGLFFDLQRIQQGTGMTEAQRITNMIHNLFNIPTIKGKKAAIICVEPQYIDLAIGVDMSTAYLEQKDLNHTFRIMETVLPRIKEPEAIVVLE